MDTRYGELVDGRKMAALAEAEERGDLETFEYREVIQVKTGFFEVVKIDLRRQRIVLKPVPRPIE